jgi:hypothetical protein
MRSFGHGRFARAVGSVLVLLSSIGLVYNGWPIAKSCWQGNCGGGDISLSARTGTTTDQPLSTVETGNLSELIKKVKGAETFGFTPKRSYVEGLNELSHNFASTFWLYHAGIGLITTEEAWIMSQMCIPESEGCNHWDRDGKVLPNRAGASSALGWHQTINHDPFVVQLNQIAGHPNYDREDFFGNINLALALCLRSKVQGRRCDEPWAESRDRAIALARNYTGSDGVETIISRRGQVPSSDNRAVTEVASAQAPMTIPNPLRSEGIFSLEPVPDFASMPDEEEVLKYPLPSGGGRSRWIKCARPSCKLVGTHHVKYLLPGYRNFMNIEAGVEVPLGQGLVQVTDGRMRPGPGWQTDMEVGYVTITQ